jgi:predicted SnoaL-like aldol condensation-catalyzing enzyme
VDEDGIDRAAGGPVTEAAQVHRRIVELVQAGRRDEALELIDPDVDHRGGVQGDHHGLAAWRAKWEQMSGPDELAVTIEDNVARGDLSVNRYTLRGTDGATGRRYEVVGLDMVRVRDGLLTEHWALLDQAAMRRQLGLDQDAAAG